MLGGLSWWKLVKIHLCLLHWTNRRIITSKRYPDSFGMGGGGVGDAGAICHRGHYIMITVVP